MKEESSLENKYSWEEIGNLVADRVEKHSFIERTVWRRPLFLKWFRERQKLGIRFDWRLIARAFVVWRDLHFKEKDHFTVIVGKEGSGKTTIGEQFCSWVSPEMDIKDIVFDMEHYVEKLTEVTRKFRKGTLKKEDKSIQIDEGGISLFSREALSKSNKILAKTFMVQRFINVHVCICIPHYWSLDTFIRNHRIDTLIIVKDRGNYKTLVHRGVRILNRIGSKDKTKELQAFPIPYAYFWEGNFNIGFTKNISKKEYEKHKLKHIIHFLDEAKMESKSIKMVNVKQIEKDFGIKGLDLINQIRNGEIDGRQIGNQWFLTRKAYEKLLMG